MTSLKQICRITGKSFTITEEDQAFYEKMGVPLPTLCPKERQRRRLAWRNERTLYKRRCSRTGKIIICMYPEGTPFPVYDHSYYFSDQWNPLDYGRDFDWSRPFFDQFHELQEVVPRMMNYSMGNENADYGNLASWNKDCYMCFEADDNRDCLYSDYSFRCIDTVDCSFAKKCELAYQCTDIQNCNRTFFCLNCTNCSSSWFLKNCKNCHNCFGCINLQNKEHYFYNERLSKEAYEARLKNLNLSSRKNLEVENQKFHDFAKTFPHKFMNGYMNENCAGDYLNNCKNAQFCFDSSELQDCKYVYNCERVKDSYDLDTYGGVEGVVKAYECQSVGRGAFNVAFGNNVYQNLTDVWYSDQCANAKDLFGCISLRHVQYCILNKQYSKEDYFTLRKKIVEHMKKTGGWGEFFPIEHSPFSYNETMAQVYYPLIQAEAEAKGYRWRELDQKEFQAQALSLADSISEVEDSICNEILACEVTKRNFKIQKAELAFYRKTSLPLPRKHPEQRYKERMGLRNPRTLWNRACQKCDVSFMSTYALERPERIMCEPCYLQEIY